MHAHRASVSVFILAVAAGCSSSEERPDTGKARDALTDAAHKALRSPGTATSTIPASALAGVKEWKIHLGSGVTVVGMNAEGQAEAAMTWQRDHASGTAVVACAIAPKRTVTCSDVGKAIAVDVAARSSGTTQTAGLGMRLFGFGEKDCADTVGEIASEHGWEGVASLLCETGPGISMGDGSLLYAEGPDPCIVSDATDEVLVSGLATKCCGEEKGTWETGNTLINESVVLICQ